MISEAVERRARWVLDTLGARTLGLGDDVPYDAAAWERLERGERPAGDALADAFWHLARLEERGAPRDRHGRFPASATSLDPLDPPLERLRRELGVAPPCWGGARFAVALTHDVDVPWRWTRIGVRGSVGRFARAVGAGRATAAAREGRALAGIPGHRLRGSDPNWCFEWLLDLERGHGARSTFYVMAGHHHPADGAAPATYERLRPRLVETLLAGGAEVGLHGSYTAAVDRATLAEEAHRLAALAGPLSGHRYHYLRVDPHTNLTPLRSLGFTHDSSLGFADALGFRAGIAHPFRPWDVEHDRPSELVEIPLAVMDVTLAEDRYLGLPARAAEREILRLLDWAGANGGGFSLLWHTDRFDRATSRGWDTLYERILLAIHERGGVCLPACELAREAAAWLG